MRLEFRVVMLQLALVGLAALVAAGLGREPLTVLLGGGCALIPNAWMALRVGIDGAEGRELRSAAGLLLAMVLKLALMVTLVTLALWRFPDLDGLAFFGGFIVALFAHHGAPLLDDGGTEERTEER